MQNFAQKKGLICNLSGLSTLGFFIDVLCPHLIQNVMFPPWKSEQVVKVGIENSGGKMAEQLWSSSCVNLTTQKRQFTFAWEEDLLLYVVQATKGSHKSSCLTAEDLHITIR
jgi:hypothetical protein